MSVGVFLWYEKEIYSKLYDGICLYFLLSSSETLPGDGIIFVKMILRDVGKNLDHCTTNNYTVTWQECLQ
jgi:hypothetical protein